MSHIRVLLCRVDEEDQMTEVAAFDLGGSDEVRLEAEHALDDLESRTHRTGNAILRRLLQAQWELIDGCGVSNNGRVLPQVWCNGVMAGGEPGDGGDQTWPGHTFGV